MIDNIKAVLYSLLILAILLPLGGCGEHHFNTKPAYRVMQDAHSGGSAVAINSASNRLVSGGWAGKLKIWILPEGKLLKQWKAHKGSVNGIAFIDHDKSIITAGYDGRVVVWDLSGNKRYEWNSGSAIRKFALMSEGRLVTGHVNGKIRLWNLADGKKLKEQQLKGADITAVAVDKPGNRIALSDQSGRAALWNLKNDALTPMDSSPSYSRSLAFSPDEKSIYGSGWFKLFRWSAIDGKITVLPTEHTGIINDIQFTPSGKLATISRQTDSSVLVLDPKNGTTLSAMGKHDLCGGYVAVAPNGCFIATNSDDSSVRIWKLNPKCPVTPVKETADSN